jgi:hypothetical protein
MKILNPDTNNPNYDYHFCTDDGSANGNPFLGIILNTNGTIYGLTASELPTGQYGNTPISPGTRLVAECCNAYASGLLPLPSNTNLNITWDATTNQCRWGSACDLNGQYKLILSPEENDGALFDVDSNETCYLEVSFDYIILFDCDTLMECAKTETSSNILASELMNCRTLLSALAISQGQYLEMYAELSNIYDSGTTQTGKATNLSQNLDNVYTGYSNNYTAFINCWNSWLNSFNSTYSTTGLSDECIKLIQGALNIAIADVNVLIEMINLISPPNPNVKIDVYTYQAQIALVNTSLTNLINTLTTCIPLTTVYGCDVISVLNNITLDTTLEVITGVTSTPPIYYQNPTRLETVYSKRFFEITPDFVTYFTNNTNTGFLFTGDCTSTINCVMDGLGENCGIISGDTFNSSWVHYSYVISQPDILSLIENQRIKLGIQINGCTCDFSLLLDNIKINKVCTKVEKADIVVNTSPGFELNREIDNKKSWVYDASPHIREYNLTLRDTNYSTNHSKLIVNTKEVDINLDSASAIECNVFDFLQNNDCILSNQICSNYTPESLTHTIIAQVVNNYDFFEYDAITLELSGWTSSFYNLGSQPDFWWAPTNTVHMTSSGNSEYMYQQITGITAGSDYLLSFNLGTWSGDSQTELNVQIGTASTPVLIVNTNTTGLTSYTVLLSSLTGDTNYDYLYFRLTNTPYEDGILSCINLSKLIYTYEPSGCTHSTIGDLLDTDMSSITNTQEFISVIQTELIDVKSRKVLSAYPTLRYIYDSYNNPSSVGCTADSRSYNYCMLTRFVDLIGTYWVDIIEQVVPATTIWGSTYVYRNTMFDQPKFKYKRSTLFYCLPEGPTDCDRYLASFTLAHETFVDIMTNGYTSCDDINDFFAYYMNVRNTYLSCLINTWYNVTLRTLSRDCTVKVRKLRPLAVIANTNFSDYITLLINAYLNYEDVTDLLNEYISAYNEVNALLDEIIITASSNCTNCSERMSYDYNVDVEYGEVQSFTANCIVTEVQADTCSGVYIKQVDDGSEFYGTVTIMKSGVNPSDSVVNKDMIIVSETIPSNALPVKTKPIQLVS